MLKIIYEDPDILVAEKPAGVESQTSRGFEPDMVSEIKNYLKRSQAGTTAGQSTKSSTRSVEPYVGVIHRLDKPVGGVMVYAKNQKAAASLSRQVQDGTMKKTYRAVVCGKPVDIVGNYVDYLLKDGKNNYSSIVDKSIPDSRRAELSYRVLGTSEAEDFKPVDNSETEALSLVEIELLTGRHHQIRVQFAAHGCPLWGDGKYNPDWGGTLPLPEKNAASGRLAAGDKAAAAGGLAAGEKTAAASRSAPAGQLAVANCPASAIRLAPSGRGSMGRGERELALAAVRLSFRHPVSGKIMEFSLSPRGRIFGRFGEV